MAPARRRQGDDTVAAQILDRCLEAALRIVIISRRRCPQTARYRRAATARADHGPDRTAPRSSADQLPAAGRRRWVDAGLFTADCQRPRGHRQARLLTREWLPTPVHAAQIGKAGQKPQEIHRVFAASMQAHDFLARQAALHRDLIQVRSFRATVAHRDFDSSALINPRGFASAPARLQCLRQLLQLRRRVLEFT